MPSVFDVLGRDHQKVRELLAELEAKSAAATGASDAYLTLRKKMVEELVIEESKHEAVEEMYFWPAVRERLPDGDRLADTATGQEQQAKETLNRLDKLDAGQPGFEQLLAGFTAAAQEHISFEETQVWPALRAVLSEEEAASLGGQLDQAEKTAPTRPHPNTPPKPSVLKGTAPAVAAADRLRDAATGRGED